MAMSCKKSLTPAIISMAASGIVLVVVVGMSAGHRTVFDRPMSMQVEHATYYVRDALLSSAAFYKEHDRMPKSLDEVFPHSFFDQGSWEDLFAPWSAIVVTRFRHLQFRVQDRTLLVYSVGPDRRDDRALSSMTPRMGLLAEATSSAF